MTTTHSTIVWKRMLILGAVLVVVFALFGIETSTFAQIDTDLADFQQETGLGNQDLKVTIAKIVRVVLGFLGIIGVVIVLYAGFMWMTAGGNEDRINLAKRILLQAGIGLLIVMTAFSITHFVLKEFGEATGTIFDLDGDGDSNGCITNCGNGTVVNFIVEDIVPSGALPNYNVSVHIVFNDDVEENTAEDGGITLRKTGEHALVDVDYETNGSMVTLKPTADCVDAPEPTTGCLDKNQKYTVEVNSSQTKGVRSVGDKLVSCGLGSACTGTFTTGDQLDLEAPTVSITQPDDGGQIPQGASVQVDALVNDDLGVSLVEFYAGADLIDTVSVDFNLPFPQVVSTNSWNTTGLSLGAFVDVTAVAYDVDDHQTTSDAVNVKVAPAHCFDDQQTPNTDETGKDCSPPGGSCGQCSGSSCEDNSQCASGVCLNLPKPPKTFMEDSVAFDAWNIALGLFIRQNDYSSPAGEGNAVLMQSGDADSKFMDRQFEQKTQGNTFELSLWAKKDPGLDSPNAITLLLSTAPGQNYEFKANTISLTDTWTKYTVTHAFENESDKVRAYIGCNQCEFEDLFAIYGATLKWTAAADPIPEGGQCVNLPIINSVTPESAGQSQWVTILGDYFGSEGSVELLDQSGETVVEIPVSQAQCFAGTSSWTETAIIIEVPGGLTVDQVYPVVVKNVHGADSTTDDRGAYLPNALTITEPDPAIPGLCSVMPNAELPGALVTFYGKNLSVTKSELDVRFSGQSAIIGDGPALSQVSATVPAISVGNFLADVLVQEKQSNPLPFTVLGEGDSPAPTIASLSRGQGPKDQYITISGNNFGYFQNVVKFIKLDAGGAPTDIEVLGNFDFPPMCTAAGVWSEKSIVVKVPETDLGNYHIAVVRNDADNDPDNDVSNSVPFEVVDGLPTPGVCALVPNNGPEGTDVFIHGEGFGDQTGTITYWKDVDAPIVDDNWQEEKLYTPVPTGAATGPVKMTNASDADSNTALFTVQNCNNDADICTDQQTCCNTGSCINNFTFVEGKQVPQTCDNFNVEEAAYAYTFYTGNKTPDTEDFPPVVIEECGGGALPSPTPWENHPGGTSVCSTASIGVKFSIAIDESTISINQGKLGSVQVYECLGASEDSTVACETVEHGQVALQNQFDYDSEIGPDGLQSYLRVYPLANFKSDTWYMVGLSSGISSLSKGLSLVGNGSCAGTALDEDSVYCYAFKTSESGNSCTIGSVQVEPAAYEISNTDQLQSGTGLILNPNVQTVLDADGLEVDVEEPLSWNAYALAKESECFILNSCSDQFTWQWQSDDPQVILPHDLPNPIACKQYVEVTGESQKELNTAGQLVVVPNQLSVVELDSSYDDVSEIMVHYGAPQVLQQCSDNIQSPTPWVGNGGGNDVCVNSVVNMVFSQLMNPATFHNDAVYVQKCTAGGDDPCSEVGPHLPSVYTFFSQDEDHDGVQLRLNAAGVGEVHDGWDTDSWYRVAVTTDLESLSGVAMEPLASCTLGDNESYCFTFKTRVSDQACAVNDVNVTPTDYTADEFGLVEKVINDDGDTAPVDWKANPLAADVCIVLDGNQYSWDWEVSDVDKALLAHPDGGTAGELISVGATQNVVANNQTDPETPAEISATTEERTGSGALHITVAPPAISTVGPTCSTACSNVAITMDFSTNVNLKDITTDSTIGAHVLVVPCANESCLIEVGADGLATPGTLLNAEPVSVDLSEQDDAIFGNRLKLQHAGVLAPATWYRVLLRVGELGIQGQSGVGIPVTSLNQDQLYPSGAANAQYFSWKFRTKTSGASCDIVNATLEPESVLVPHVGIVKKYTAHAFGSPDDCSPSTGQELQASSYNWNWSIGNTKVAELLKDQDGTLFDLAVVDNSLYCTPSCLGKGSQPVGTPVCGDGLLVEGVESCDDGNIFDGDGCSSSCLWEGNTEGIGSVCGDGNTTYGEACDGEEGCNNVLCLWLGAASPFSECGNGDIGVGEECDGGVSCEQCLLTGSAPGYDACESAKLIDPTFSCVGVTVCGNGEIEPGEDEFCETAAASSSAILQESFATVCTDQCTLVGNTLTENSDGGLYCGDGLVTGSNGEQCDDANSQDGDGCSANCLLEGASLLNGSFCGNGVVEVGELTSCDSTAIMSIEGDSKVDPVQYVYGVDCIGPGCDGLVQDNKRSTSVTADYGTVEAVGSYAIQCGFTHDAQCPDATDWGVGTDTCCHLRPEVVPGSEQPIGSNLCRNVMLSVEFTDQINPDSVLAPGAIQLNIDVDSPEACTDLNGSIVALSTTNPNDPWYRRAWFAVVNTVRGWFSIEPIYAQVTCADTVDFDIQLADIQTSEGGNITTVTKLFLIPKELLSPGVTYYPTITTDVENSIGVGLAADYDWQFDTDESICQIDKVVVEPGSYVFTTSGLLGQANFVAVAQTMLGGQATAITTTNDYAWDWSWELKNDVVAHIVGDAVGDSVSVQPESEKGTDILMANATITVDTLSEVSTTGEVYNGFASLINTACENPWPIPDPALGGVSFPYEESDTHFSTWYCRGNNAPTPPEGATPQEIAALQAQHVLLPSVTVHDVADPDPNVIKSVFFRNPQNNEVIGVRVLSNPEHLSAQDWYSKQGFTGSPTATEVGGYQAITEGKSTYIAAANLTGASYSGFNQRYTNMYVVSHSEDASASTKSIANQMLQNMLFNTNIAIGYNIDRCGYMNPWGVPSGSYFENKICNSPLDCLNDTALMAGGFNENSLTCRSINEQLQRDVIRMADLAHVGQLVEAYKIQHGQPPQLTEGSFIGGQTVSTWASWQDVLGKELGEALPVDPLNAYRTGCGAEGTDDQTCWDEQAQTYQCLAGSKVYTYRRHQVGAPAVYGYRLYAEGELRSPWSWKPSNSLSGAQYMMNPVCTGQPEAPGGICGDGVLNVDEDCEFGTIVGATVLEGGIGASGIQDPKSCSVVDENGVSFQGKYVYECPANCQFYSAVQVASPSFVEDYEIQCQPLGFCGDGIVLAGTEVCDDGPLNGSYNACSADCQTDYGEFGGCADGQIQSQFGEVCDPGIVIQVKAHLTDGSQHYTSVPVEEVQSAMDTLPTVGGGTPKTYQWCLDQSGDTCWTQFQCLPDGTCPLSGLPCVSGCHVLTIYKPTGAQTIYAHDQENSCNWDCQEYGPYCGDSVKQSPQEECDGGDGVIYTGDACTKDGIPGQFVQLCSNECTLLPEKCLVNQSSEPLGASPAVCGNGVHEPNGGEECDNGASNGSVCAAQYGESCTYCSNICKKVTLTGGTCGDGIKQLQEQCDTNDVGTKTCANSTEFPAGIVQCNVDCTLNYDACTYVYCGDGILGGAEECDGDTFPSDVLCSEGGPLCDSSCKIDLSQCGSVCGDGIRQATEECEGFDFGGLDCGDFTFGGGFFGDGDKELYCTNSCTIDDSECHEVI